MIFYDKKFHVELAISSMGKRPLFGMKKAST